MPVRRNMPDDLWELKHRIILTGKPRNADGEPVESVEGKFDKEISTSSLEKAIQLFFKVSTCRVIREYVIKFQEWGIVFPGSRAGTLRWTDRKPDVIDWSLVSEGNAGRMSEERLAIIRGEPVKEDGKA